MKHQEHYITILLSLDDPDLHSTHTLTIDYLASLLHCTTRNVKWIIRKLQEEGYIHWQSGRGRGHHSTLTILQSLEHVLGLYFEQLLVQGKLQEAAQWLQHPQLPHPYIQRLQYRLEQQFGLHIEHHGTQTLDVLRINQSRILESLDPAFVFTAFESHLIGQICSLLITYQAESQTFMPRLAHYWESDDTDQCWTFYLRKGVRFHHGRILTAQDVKYTWERLRDLDSPAFWQFTHVESVVIHNDYTISFYLQRSDPFFLNYISSLCMSILPHDHDIGDKGRQLVGTGAFRLTTSSENHIVLDAFDAYFEGRSLLDRVDIYFVTADYQADRRYQLFRQNKATDYTDPAQVNYKVIGCNFLMFNFCKEGIQHDSTFRQVIHMLLDRPLLTEQCSEYWLKPAYSLFPWKSKQTHATTYSLEQARQYLQQTDYQGQSLNLNYLNRAENHAVCVWLQERARSIGLIINLCPRDSFASTAVMQEADLFMGQEMLEENIVWGLLNFFSNRSTYVRQLLNPAQLKELDKLLVPFVAAPLPDYSQHVEKIEQFLHTSFLFIPVYHSNQKLLFDPSFQGLYPDAFGWINLSKLWIKPTISPKD